MNRTTTNVLEAVACIGLIAGTAFLINAESAEARTVCRYNEFLDTTTCDGPSGRVIGRHNDFLDQTVWDGPGGRVTCRHNDFLGTTTCD